MEPLNLRAPSSLILCFGLFSGCGEDVQGSPQNVPDAGGVACRASDATAPRVLSNNSAELEGACFGLGWTPNDALRKPIRIDLLQPEPRFTAGQAYAMRETLNDPVFEIAFMVTNVGPTSACFIRLRGYRRKDAMGAVLAGTITLEPYVGGSVLAIGGTWTDTCLLPGESGWTFDIDISPQGTDLYSSVAAVEFEYSASDRSATPPPPRVIPDGYTVSADGFETVGFTNSGTGPAAITDRTFSKFIALDDAGAPLFWDYLGDRIQPLGLLQPGESGSESTQFPIIFRGTAHRMRAIIDFLPPATLPDASFPNQPHPASPEEQPGSRALEMVRASRQRELHMRSLFRHARGLR